MVNVPEALYNRYNRYDNEAAHPELVPGSDAGALQADNTFVPGTPNASIDAVWGRTAALLPNDPVPSKFQKLRLQTRQRGHCHPTRSG